MTRPRPEARTAVIRRGVQSISPVAVVLAAYLLFAGHNRPGGGFAAGLVLGCVVALRTTAGLSRPSHAVALLSGGLSACGLIALLPLLGGGSLLDQTVVDAVLPVVGTVKTGTALVFDVGVTAVVLGVVMALFEGLARPVPGGPPTDGSSPS